MWGQEGCVCVCVCVYVCVTWNPYILHQAVNNHDAISQSEQLTHGIAIMSLYMTQQQSVHRKSMNSVNSANSPLTASVSTLLLQQVYQQCYCSLTANVLKIWQYWNNYMYKNLLEMNVIICLVLVFIVITLSLNI